MPLIRTFRYIAFVEGVTTLALFLVAMPLKYAFDFPHLVPPVGLTHGIAWLIYIPAMVVCLWGKQLGLWGWVRTTLASFVPFGTFLNDPFLKRREQALAAAS